MGEPHPAPPTSGSLASPTVDPPSPEVSLLPPGGSWLLLQVSGESGDQVAGTSVFQVRELRSEQLHVQSCLLRYFLKSEGSKSLEASGWLGWGVFSLQPHYKTHFVRQKSGTWALGGLGLLLLFCPQKVRT